MMAPMNIIAPPRRVGRKYGSFLKISIRPKKMFGWFFAGLSKIPPIILGQLSTYWSNHSSKTPTKTKEGVSSRRVRLIGDITNGTTELNSQ
jgi:hypothetical protein